MQFIRFSKDFNQAIFNMIAIYDGVIFNNPPEKDEQHITYNSIINGVMYLKYTMEYIDINRSGDQILDNLHICSQFIASAWIFSTIDLHESFVIKYKLPKGSEPESIDETLALKNKIAVDPQIKFYPIWDSIEYVMY